MFVQSDNTESRSVENEIVRRLAIRVVDAFTNDVKPASTQEISCECRNRRVDEYASESGLVTLAGIEMILEEALYPILDRLVMIERKLCHSDVDSSRQQDVPITVTPSSTPAFVYDNDDRLQLSPDGKYTFSGSLFDTSDFASFEDDGNEYGSSADSVSDSSREKLKETGGSRRDTFYRSFFKAPDPPRNKNSDKQTPHTYVDVTRTSQSLSSPPAYSFPFHGGHGPSDDPGITSKTGLFKLNLIEELDIEDDHPSATGDLEKETTTDYAVANKLRLANRHGYKKPTR